MRAACRLSILSQQPGSVPADNATCSCPRDHPDRRHERPKPSDACYIEPAMILSSGSNQNLKVAVYGSFDQLPENARTLCASAAPDRWFDSLDWFHCLYSTALADAVQPRAYVVTDDSGEAVACLFCCTREAEARELASLSNYYTMEFGPVLRAGTDAASVGAALACFIAAERPRWHTVRLDYLKTSNAATTALVGAFERAGYAVYRHHQYENWYLDCPGTGFDEYFAARPSRLRNTVERKGRKLYKSHKVDFVLYRGRADDVDRGVHDYVTVYNSSWKRPEPHPAFIPGLARRLAAIDCLRLGVLYADGKAVAAQFWITTKSEACIYKLAYDEQYAELSVGAVLSREMFRQALDVDHAARIDYGVGSEAYKREWMSGMQEVFGIRAYSRQSIEGLARIVAARLKTGAKRLAGRPR